MSNIDTFAAWLRRQGHRVVQTESSWWYDAAPHIMQAFPYDWLIQPSWQELRRLMKQEKVVALRYSTPLTAHPGMISYHIMLEPPYCLEKLKSQARNGVKRGLSNATVEEISFKRLATEGWLLQRDTLERQNRLMGMTQAEWEKICLAADDLPGFTAWGTLVDGELAAALITCRIGDTYYVPYATSYRKFLNLYVNNALFYQASCAMLDAEGIKKIFFSLHSLDAPASVNEFKIRMGLQIKPVRQRVVFHPHARLFLNRLTCDLLSGFTKRKPDNVTASKAYGMLFFYLNGNLPLEQQVWPDCLANSQADILSQLAHHD